MSNEPKAGMNLDPDMLAAYIDKRLSPEQRAEVEAQLARDPDSYAVLVETLKALEEVPEAQTKVPGVPGVPEVRVPGSRRWVIAGSLLAAAAAVVLVVRLQPDLLERLRGDRVDPRLERLVAAIGDERYFEARITGGFKHAPLAPTTRAPRELSQQNLALLAAAGELQKTAQQAPTAQNLHAWGVAQLLLGQLDGAIDVLSTAATQTDDRALLSDLAAAYVTRAQLSGRSEDWPQALSSASRAVEQSPRPIPEALFNRALSAESLNLRSAAEEYWNAYLTVETDPAWRAEATRHLDALKSQRPQSWRQDKPQLLEAAALADQPTFARIVARHTQKTRELIEDELLPAWAREEIGGEAIATATLSNASRLAGVLAATTSDDLLALSIERIASSDPATRRRIATAVRDYAAGRQLYEGAAMQDSVAPFTRALNTFSGDDIALAEWCRLYLATALYYKGDYPGSNRILDDILRRTNDRSWLALTARTHWMQGLIATLSAEYDQALVSYTRTLQLFERSDEQENQAAVHSLLATTLLYLGDDEQMWGHTVRALQTTTPESAFRRQHMVLVGAANRAARLDLPDAALVFAVEAAAVNRQWQDPIAGIEVANYRARALLQLKRSDEAREEVDSARRALGLIADPGLRRRAEAEVMQTETDVLAVADPTAGVEAATRAIDYFTKARSSLRVPRLYAARAAARQRLGDRDGALIDLRAGAASFDSERQTLPRSDRLRLAYSDEVWSVYRQLVAAEVDRGSGCEQVLAAAERARAATLAHAATEDEPAMANGDSTTVTLSYSFVGDRLVIIALRGGRCELAQSSVTASTIRDELRLLHAELAAPEQAANGRSPSELLFQQLIEPAWRHIDGAQRLEIVADGALHYVPFSVLRNRIGTRLIEITAIRMLPGLSESVTTPNPIRRALVSAGGPVRDLKLPALPGAKSEIAAVASALEDAQFTIREAADGASFVAGLHDADVVHFAGHAIVNPQYPLLSKLMVGDGAHQWVTAEQVSAANPGGARLVFLSACSTQAGRLFGGEGPASLARAFLASGARDVVASLWPVADGTTPALVSSFYRSWTRNGDPAEALRHAMMTAIRDRKLTPQQWAAWVVVGRKGGSPPVRNRH
jgi:CHAT domain-containing protein